MTFLTIVKWMAFSLVAILSPIILIHELGHFIFAKLAGVRVEEFGLGLPPRLLKLWTGAGYLEIDGRRIRIPGRFRLPPDLGVGMQVRALAHRNDDGSYALRRLEPLTPDLPPLPLPGGPDDLVVRGELTALEPGTIYSLNWLPLGAFVKMTGEDDPSDPRSLAAQPKRWRLAVIAAGPLFNLIAAVLLIIAAYGSGVPEKWFVHITDIVPGSAAEEAGLRPGDIIIAADGNPIEDGTLQVRNIVQDSVGREITLTILRDGRRLTLSAAPTVENGHLILGIYMEEWPDMDAVHHYLPGEAIRAGLKNLTDVFLTTVTLPVQVAQGTVPLREARPVSLIGIVEMLALILLRSIRWGLPFLVIRLAAIVSLVLGLTNLLPLPALDGGRIFFILVEAVAGDVLSSESEGKIHMVGMFILLVVSFFLILMDLVFPILSWSLLEK